MCISSFRSLKNDPPEFAPALRSWYTNWNELLLFFNFPMEIRKIIYTTNIIESLNSQFRKVSNSRSVYPSEDALLKVLYLASKNILKNGIKK